MNIPGKPNDMKSFQASQLSIVILPHRADSKMAKYGKACFFKYADGPARWVVPDPLRTAFGVQESNLDGANKDLTASFDVPDPETHPDIKNFFTKLREAIAELAFANKTHLWKTPPKTLESTHEKIADLIKYSEKGYPPIFKTTVVTDWDNPEKILSIVDKPLLIDENKQPIEVTRSTISSIVGRNSVLRPVIEIKHLFVSNNGVANIKLIMSHAKLMQSGSTAGSDWDFDDDAVPAQSQQPDEDGEDDEDDEDEMDSS